ncbi:MAG: NifB/NifX family molybdenum-iron cluster-binding protein [Rubrivivax sp.]|nr:NifB/NifX family molybdenum-iron cluster-binding protein [Rubrivivax sp.]
MTLIALTCQNRREITEHAGQCRKFLIYEVDGTRIGEPRLLELPQGASFHETPGDQPHALDGVDLLISASMGDGLRRKLALRGIRTLLTTERDPLVAVQRLVQGALPDEGATHTHTHDHGAEPHPHEAGEGHAHGGCGHCGCHGRAHSTPAAH